MIQTHSQATDALFSSLCWPPFKAGHRRNISRLIPIPFPQPSRAPGAFPAREEPELGSLWDPGPRQAPAPLSSRRARPLLAFDSRKLLRAP